MDSTASPRRRIENWIDYMKSSAREPVEKMTDIQHHKSGRNTKKTEVAISPPDRHSNGQENPLSGIWDSSYRRDLEEKYENQPKYWKRFCGR